MIVADQTIYNKEKALIVQSEFGRIIDVVRRKAFKPCKWEMSEYTS